MEKLEEQDRARIEPQTERALAEQMRAQLQAARDTIEVTHALIERCREAITDRS